jgi:TatA/E family protein of Tat protein translocase
MFGIGTTELVIIMFIILLIFGAKKLPELAQGLGKGIREFKKASNEIQDELNFNNTDQIKPTTDTPKSESETKTSDDDQKKTED